MFHNDLSQTPIDFCEQTKLIRGLREIIYISLRPSNRFFTKVENYIEAGAMDHWRLYKENGEPQLSLWKSRQPRKKIFKCRLESWQRTTINIICPCMFHLNGVENDGGGGGGERSVFIFCLSGTGQ